MSLPLASRFASSAARFPARLLVALRRSSSRRRHRRVLRPALAVPLLLLLLVQLILRVVQLSDSRAFASLLLTGALIGRAAFEASRR